MVTLDNVFKSFHVHDWFEFKGTFLLSVVCCFHLYQPTLECPTFSMLYSLTNSIENHKAQLHTCWAITTTERVQNRGSLSRASLPRNNGMLWTSHSIFETFTEGSMAFRRFKSETCNEKYPSSWLGWTARRLFLWYYTVPSTSLIRQSLFRCRFDLRGGNSKVVWFNVVHEEGHRMFAP